MAPPSAMEPEKDLILVHTVQLKPMTKTHSSQRMVSSGISDVVIASVHFEKTHLIQVRLQRASRSQVSRKLIWKFVLVSRAVCAILT